MRLMALGALVVLTVGCTSQTTDTVVTPPVSNETSAPAETGSPESFANDANEIPLTAENTVIQFVGTHVGSTPDPNARTGHFGEFAGKAIVEDDDLKSITVEIQTASVDTGIDKLNNHLQAEDFFSVREFPDAKFESTRIARDEDGNFIISGNLTLLGTTKEISFPARVGMSDGSLDLSAKLTLDRTEFGMSRLTDRVNTDVALTIGIGKVAQEDATSDP